MFRTAKWYMRELERRDRAHAAERAELIKTICHLTGRPLPEIEPPVKPFDPTTAPDAEKPPRYVAAPEQYPLA